uniref:Polycomb protein Scm-like n=1 Tax=Dermatophagoides pteronyssinus TaxID=6956 RepID=A0A6P6YJS5_DERPT|nr:polycomb protein Scm-like [Dermatophagoides pteronyssinus]
MEQQNGNGDGHVSDVVIGANDMKTTPNITKKNNNRIIRSLDWDDYLKVCPGRPAPAQYFNHHLDPPDNEFKINQKLEVSSPDSHDFVHLATVVGYMGPRLQLRLDGCDNANDFFELVDSEAISPIGTYKSKGRFFAAPLRFRRDAATYASFCKQVLKNSFYAPERCFKSPPKRPERNYFEPGMKLEAVDKKHPSNICPATIKSVDNMDVEIHLDGWDNNNDYKCPYHSRHLFPVGWCKKTGHILQLPGPKVEYEIDTKKQQRQQQQQSDTSIRQNDLNPCKQTNNNNNAIHSNNNHNNNKVHQNHHEVDSSLHKTIKVESTVVGDEESVKKMSINQNHIPHHHNHNQNKNNDHKIQSITSSSSSSSTSTSIDISSKKQMMNNTNKLVNENFQQQQTKPNNNSNNNNNNSRKSLINSISLSDHHNNSSSSSSSGKLASTASKLPSPSSLTLASDSSIKSSKNIDINKRKHSENNHHNHHHHHHNHQQEKYNNHGTDNKLENSSASLSFAATTTKTTMSTNLKSMEIPLMNAAVKRSPEDEDQCSSTSTPVTSKKIARKSIVGNGHNQNNEHPNQDHDHPQQQPIRKNNKLVEMTQPAKLPLYFVNGQNNNDNNNDNNIVMNNQSSSSSMIMKRYANELPTREIVDHWSVDELLEFLNIRFPEFHKFEQNFRSHEIDGNAFLLLDNHDLMMKFLGVKLGYSLKIIDLIEKINTGGCSGNIMDTTDSSLSN